MTIACRAAVWVAVVLITVAAWAQSATSLDDLLTTLRAGGQVIVVRHGATHADQADTDPLNLENVAKQRQLNDKGRADARSMGEALKRAGIPIGRVYSRRFQRAVETSRRIAGKEPEPPHDVAERGQVVRPRENARPLQALRPMARRARRRRPAG